MKGIVWNGFIDVTDELEVRRPEPSEVLVHDRLRRASATATTAWSTAPSPSHRPVVLGHEGAGVVEAVGSAVTKVKVGDHVVLHTLSSAGPATSATGVDRPTAGRRWAASPSRSPTRANRPTPSPRPAVFSEYTVVGENQAVAHRRRRPAAGRLAAGLRRHDRRRRRTEPGQGRAGLERAGASAWAASASMPSRGAGSPGPPPSWPWT